MATTVLTHAEIIVAVLATLSTLKSAYNGWIRSLVNDIGMIPEVHDNQQEMKKTQNRLVDAVIALSIAERDDGREVDPRKVEQELLENGSARDYLQESDSITSPYSDFEDEEEVAEEEARWRREYDD